MIENFLAGTATLFGDPFTIGIFIFGVLGGMLFGAIPGVSMLTLAAAKVSMLTPGIAPKSIPPNTPKMKIPIVKGSPKSVAVPAKKFSIMTNHQNI